MTSPVRQRRRQIVVYLPEIASGTVRVHDARFQASGRTTTVTGAGGAPRVDPRVLDEEGAGAGASS